MFFPIHRYQGQTISHLESFAQEGLRTLVLASRDLSDDEYARWSEKFKQATTDVKNKEAAVERAAELVERDLKLLGATAIEDKLQEGVPETIAQLLEANIHVWVLTGDKQVIPGKTVCASFSGGNGTYMYIVNVPNVDAC